MFNATFVSSSTFVSKKGESFYKIELIAETLSNKTRILSDFCTANAFENSRSIPSMARVRVACGVNDYGKVVINAIKEDK